MPLPENTDFMFANCGGMVALTPISSEAREACEDGTIGFESWQMLGGSLMVDHRMAPDLIGNLQEDGYTVIEE